MHMLHLEAMGQGPTVGARRRFLDKAKLVGEELAGASGRKLRPGEGDGVWLELTQRWRAEETEGRVWHLGECGVRESEGPDPRRGAQEEEQWGRKAGPHACVLNARSTPSAPPSSSRARGRLTWLSNTLLEDYRCRTLRSALKMSLLSRYYFHTVQKLF